MSRLKYKTTPAEAAFNKYNVAQRPMSASPLSMPDEAQLAAQTQLDDEQMAMAIKASNGN